MHMLRHRWWIGIVGALALFVPGIRAQQQQGQNAQPQQGQSNQQAEKPIPAYQSPLSGAVGSGENSSETVQPDTRPLAGAQYITPGGLQITRSYWEPFFDVAGTADSNPGERAVSTANWSTWTTFLAGFDIHHISGSSNLALGYAGGGSYSNSGVAANGVIQELNVAETVSSPRYVLSFFDQLNYLPQAAFGFGGAGGLPLSEGASAGLGPGFTTSQSILTGQGQHLANSVAVQIDTYLTPRASLTLTGGSSVLRYFNSGYLDSASAIARGGYNYQLTQKNTIALLYQFEGIRYRNINQSIDTHTVHLSFARRVTGRLAFQLGAGPEIAWFQTPISGGSANIGGGSGTGTQKVYWSLDSNLQYQWARTGVGLTYFHGVSGGSGVLAGSITDSVRGSVTRKMSRTFSSGLMAGYSRNNGLPVGTGGLSSQTYDYWFVGASFVHPLSTTTALRFSYQLQYQNSNSTFCIGPSCGTNVVRHLISVSLGWHQRPLVF